MRALREACQVENDPELITSYLTFLAKHVAAPNADLHEMTELVFYMAQLIVERSTIMTAILPSAYDGDSSNNIALEALLKIFYTYLNKVYETSVRPYWQCCNRRSITTISKIFRFLKTSNFLLILVPLVIVFNDKF